MCSNNKIIIQGSILQKLKYDIDTKLPWNHTKFEFAMIPMAICASVLQWKP